MASDPFEFARCQLVLDYPFFAVLALHMPAVEVDPAESGVDTAAVDGKTLYYSRAYVERLKEPERTGLLAHEVMHCALGHCLSWRKGGREHLRWNMACDYVINLIVKEMGLKLPRGGLYKKAYAGMSCEQVYDLLEDAPMSSRPKRLTLRDVRIAGGADGEGHGMPGAEKATEDELRRQEGVWKARVMAAAQAQRRMGCLSANLIRLLDDLLVPRVPWQQLLERYVGELIRDDYDELNVDRRLVQYGLYIPGLGVPSLNVVVAVDTSGSVSREEFTRYFSELLGILASHAVAEVRLMACDAAISLDTVLQSGDPLPEYVEGGGGTDFRPVFVKLEEEQVVPTLLIYFTDLVGRFPGECPQYPVLWVTKKMPHEMRGGVPFGAVIETD